MEWRQTIVALYVFCACSAIAASTDHEQLPVTLTGETETVDDVCLTPECKEAASWILSGINTNVDPCDDFYEFACGNTTLPNLSSYDRRPLESQRIEEQLLNRLRVIIESIDKRTVPKHFGLIRTLYDNCMNDVQPVDSKDITADAYTSFIDANNRSHGWPVIVGNRWNGSFIGPSEILSETVTFNLGIVSGNPKRPAIEAEVKDSQDMFDLLTLGFDHEIVQTYYKYMVDVAVVIGAERVNAQKELKEALLFGIALANCFPPVGGILRKPGYWQRTTAGEFVEKYPKLPLREKIFSLTEKNASSVDNYTLVAKGNFEELEKIIIDTPNRDIINWFWWNKIFKSIWEIGLPAVYALTERLSKYFGYHAVSRPKWHKCVETIRDKLPAALSALYQRQHTNSTVLSDINAIFANMKREFSEILQQSSWMDNNTKQEALKTVSNIIGFVPYHDEYKDDRFLERYYRNVSLVDGSLEASLKNLSGGNYQIDTLENSNFGDSWTKTSGFLKTSAAYIYPFNILVISAASTLKNMYDINRPRYLNYGTLGWIVGHELSHSFDFNAIVVDQNGVLRDRRLPATKEKFINRMQCLIEQYGNYTVDGLNSTLNGERVVSEYFADNNGVRLAYLAYRRWMAQNVKEKQLPGLPYTPEQMFWIAGAKPWCTVLEKPTFRQYIATDAHPIPIYRVNGVFSNRPEFAEDFKCKPGTRMNPLEKCNTF